MFGTIVMGLMGMEGPQDTRKDWEIALDAWHQSRVTIIGPL
jgi:hypothetical protein